MRLHHWICRLGAPVLAVTLATSIHAATGEKIVIDGSTGMMPLVAVLAKAYQDRYPAVTVEMGKGLGTKARIQALAAGTIDVALASHGLVAEELTRQGMAVHEIAKVAVVEGARRLTRDSFLVTKATPPSVVFGFVEFIRSPAGAAVIRANGAVPVK